jgi:transcriptional regulator with XRE-family HTH domain
MTELRNIEAERVRHGLSREDLARGLGVTTRTYFSWINRATEIPSGKLLEMSKLWGVSVDYLLAVPDEGGAA